jgi:hypothetical protein
MIALIFSVVSILVPIILKNGTTSNLIQALLGPAQALISKLISGGSASSETLAALAAAMAVATALKSNTSLPADTLTEVDNVLSDLQAGLTAYVKAGIGFDPTVYIPIIPVA